MAPAMHREAIGEPAARIARGGRAPRRRWTRAAALALLAAMAPAVAAPAIAAPAAEEAGFHGLPFEPPRAVPDVEFVDQRRQPVRISDYRGQLVLLYFGFLSCPEACPMTLAIWRRVRAALGERAEEVRFVFVTVAPERDTPEKIGEHLALFDPDFVGLSASLADTEDFARELNAFFAKEDVGSAAGYLVNHTTTTFVIDRRGRLVLAFPLKTRAGEITADLDVLLKAEVPFDGDRR